jgi:hypothetical protein
VICDCQAMPAWPQGKMIGHRLKRALRKRQSADLSQAGGSCSAVSWQASSLHPSRQHGRPPDASFIQRFQGACTVTPLASAIN